LGLGIRRTASDTREKITKRTVEAIPSGPRDVFLWDNELRGFGCKVTPKGNRIYVLQNSRNNRDHRVTIGRTGWKSRQNKLDRRLGAYVVSVPRARTLPTTLLARARRRWLSSVSATCPNTQCLTRSTPHDAQHMVTMAIATVPSRSCRKIPPTMRSLAQSRAQAAICPRPRARVTPAARLRS
jgi:hypothetical protein